MNRIKHVTTAFVSTLVLVLLTAGLAAAQKLSAEEILAKHLDAIGSAETRKNLKNHVATGVVQYRLLRQAGIGGDGKIVFASEGPKSLLGITLPITNYPADTIVFDGKKFKIPFTYNNRRSDFGDYLFRYSEPIKEGLLGGTLSTSWALNDLAARKAKLDLDGTKKINDREAYAISYLPKGGSDLQITIYVDKENFQHLRTEYKRIISAGQGASPNSSSELRERRENMIEDFSDYKTVNGLTLPHKYRIYLLLEGQNSGTREVEFKAEFSQFYVNQPLDAATFVVDGK